MKDRTPLRATFQDGNSQSDRAFRSDSSFDPGVLERQAIAALIRADRAALEALASEAAERLRAGAQPEISAEAVETHRLYAAVLAHSARNLRLLHRRHQARMEAHLRLSGPA